MPQIGPAPLVLRPASLPRSSFALSSFAQALEAHEAGRQRAAEAVASAQAAADKEVKYIKEQAAAEAARVEAELEREKAKVRLPLSSRNAEKSD